VHGDRSGRGVRGEYDEPWWHELWLPFAEADGTAQVIDLRPGPGYLRVGFAIHDGTGDFDDGWPSLGAYLTDVADVLDHGGSVKSCRRFSSATENCGGT
jgi:cell wall assembly regulator SMI1